MRPMYTEPTWLLPPDGPIQPALPKAPPITEAPLPRWLDITLSVVAPFVVWAVVFGGIAIVQWLSPWVQALLG